MNGTMTAKRGAGCNQVLIAGYYGRGNFGDEAILAILIDGLRSEGFDPVVVSADADATARAYDVLTVHCDDLVKHLSILASARGAILGGGSVIKDTAFYGGASAGLALVDLAIAVAAGRCAVAFAVGTGHVRSLIGWVHIRRILNCTDALYARDRSSLDQLRDHGVTAPSRLAADPLFALYGSLPESALQRPDSQEERDRLRLAVSLSITELSAYEFDHPGISQAIVLAIHQTVIRLYEERDVYVHLVVMQDGHTYSDYKVLDELGTMLKADGIATSSQSLADMEIDRAVDFIRRHADAVLAMRYHAVALALLTDKPLVAVSSDRKVRALMCEAMSEDFHIELVDADAELLKRSIEHALQHPAPGRKVKTMELRDRAVWAQGQLHDILHCYNTPTWRRRAEGSAAVLLLLVRISAEALIRRVRAKTLSACTNLRLR